MQPDSTPQLHDITRPVRPGMPVSPGDAPCPLDALLGPALLADVSHCRELDGDYIRSLPRTSPVERLLLRTGCWTDPNVFPEHFPALTSEAAAELGRAGVRPVGTDAPSVDPFHSQTLDAHRELGRWGVAILEDLLLHAVPVGAYRLIALPLRLEQADASRVRAVLLPL